MGAQSEGVKTDIPPVTGKTEANDKKGEPTNRKQEVTVGVPPSVNMNLASEFDLKNRNEQTRMYEEPSKWLDPLTWFTLVLAVANVFLWLTTKDLATEAKVTSGFTKQSADAAIVSSMPVLSPLITGLQRLHPLSPVTATFTAYTPFVFENFGKTPGLIREVRANLFLCKMDEFPPFDLGKLQPIGYEPIVAGDSRGQNALMAVAECQRQFTLTQIEFNELLNEATEKYRRFALIGQVIYDDFFGMRHTRRFCVKMRRMGSDGIFQLVRGGPAYNRVDRQQIPKNDPFGVN